jgi:hypothetical protein
MGQVRFYTYFSANGQLCTSEESWLTLKGVVQITGESCFFFVRSERLWTFHMPEILQLKYQLWAFRLGGGCRL